MKKGIIFIGAAGTGKSRTADQIRKFFGDDAILIYGRGPRPFNCFPLQMCEKNTRLIIIDEITHLQNLDFAINLVSGEFQVNCLNKEVFKHQIEKLIVICSDDIKRKDLPQGALFNRHFTIVEFPAVASEFLINEIVGDVDESKSGKSLLLEGLLFLGHRF